MGGNATETEAEILARINRENKKSVGNIKNKMTEIDEAIDNASPGFAGDRKYDAQLVADDLAEKRFGKEFYDLDEIDQMELYDEAYQGLSKQRFLDANPISEKPTFRLNADKFKEDFNVSDEELEKILALSPEEQQKVLQDYIDKDFKQQIELSDFDVTDKEPNAQGGIVGLRIGSDKQHVD